tara:strand:+ start:117567 stop:118628 length:1062 start_codon:yes stop_codon:yes gene_type:complete
MKNGRMNISLINIRYEIYPQMEMYDSMPSGRTVPYAMLAGPDSFKSDAINTDSFGFRLSKYEDKFISCDNIADYEKINIIVGGSTVFGVGATSDTTTIASLLSEQTDTPWLNLGVRAGVSFQEYIHLIMFLHKANKIENIVFFSGVNDVYINELTEERKSYDNRFCSGLELLDYKKALKVSVIAKILRLNVEDILGKSLKEIFSFWRSDRGSICSSLSKNEKIRVLRDNTQRNFLLYSSLKKELSSNILYILQPFSSWADKSLSSDELQVFEYLDKLQAKTKWGEQKSRMGEKSTYYDFVAILNEASESHGIEFVDSNPYFSGEESLFVDSVHLNDQGNRIAARIILDNLVVK